MSEEFNLEEAIFTIIAGAGEARAKVFEAMTLAESGNLAGAKEVYASADEELHTAHRMQTSFIQQESDGNKVDISMLFLHAQDHLMTAISEKALTGKIIALHEKIANLDERLRLLENK